ncbi:MAG TPA: alpha-amylase family glycosyl hydrolase, partial [Candidatus Onthovivens sp.]|nr:alpha-amylase family glycosyl hydrolase [Candidatus Onthovivens sp.]
MKKNLDFKGQGLRNKIIYQAFVRNYTESGTFKEFEEHLQYIKDLGTDILYLLPVNPIGKKARKGVLGSPYAIKDYMSINRELGTLKDFTHLI